MKKIIYVLVFILSFSSIFASEKTFNFGLGFLTPKDANTGMLWNISSGIKFDERVDFNFSASLFHKSVSNKSLLETKTNETITSTVSKVESDNKFTYIPLMVNTQIDFPLNDEIPFIPYFKGGLGVGFLWTSIEKNNNDESKFYAGFNWQIGAGTNYQLGSKSKLYGEFFYNGANLKSKEDSMDNYKIVEEVNMGGIGMLFGIKVEY